MVSFSLRIRTLALGVIISLCCWISIWLLFKFFQPLQHIGTVIDGASYDFTFRSKPKNTPFKKLIIIDVEDQREDLTGADYAKLIHKLAAKVKVIGVDLRFIGISDSLAAQSLADTIERYSEELILAYRFGKDLTSPDEAVLSRFNLLNTIQPIPGSWQNFKDELRDETWYDFFKEQGVELPFSLLFKKSAHFGLGHTTYYLDYDDRLRHFPMIIRWREGFYPSLSLEMVKRFYNATYSIQKADERFVLQKDGESSLAIPLDINGQILINLIPFNDFNKYTLTNLPDPLPEDFNDAIVLIVNSKAESEWIEETPFHEPYPKWAFHSSIISQILGDQKFIKDDPMDSFFWGELVIVLSIIWLIGFEYRLKPEKRIPWIILLILNIVYIAFIYFMLCLDVRLIAFVPLIVINVTYILTRKQFYTIIKPPSFLNIELLVGKIQNETYQVSITHSPFGVASGTCKNFLNESAFKDSINNIRNFSYHERDLSFVGCRLFQALLSTEVQRIYDRCSAQAERDKKILRLKLRIDADELATLPWELLHDAQLRKGFIALSKQMSLKRDIQSIGEPNLLNLNLPLKILVMISSPKGLPQLDVATEKLEIKKAFRSLILLRDVQITFTEKATPEELEKYLERGIQIFHYIGHSSFNPETNEGRLALEDDDDNLNWVEADRLAYLMQKSKVQIVIFNSCESAATSEVDAFSGISQKLINAGVPSIIAMQYPVTDPTAILFSKKFYSTFIQHFSIDEAVNQARRSIMTREGVGKVDWATPVLFSSVDGGWWDKFKL